MQQGSYLLMVNRDRISLYLLDLREKQFKFLDDVGVVVHAVAKSILLCT